MAEPPDDLDTVLIGGREKREIVIADYDPGWRRRFEAERERIVAALATRAIGVEHVGSTSVPGLGAKPIVDILLMVDDVEDETAFLGPLERAGYGLRVRERGHRMFRTPGRDVHVHVWSSTDPEVRRHLVFRDWLRHSAADRGRYEALKRSLATQDWDDMNEYAGAKGDLIKEIDQRAAGWARAVGWSLERAGTFEQEVGA